MLASGRALKKLRCLEKEPPDDGGDEVMMEERRPKPCSFKDAVLNTGSEAPSLESQWETEDFDLHEGDVKKFMVDGVLTIDFSNRVYGLIDESMSKTLVVKLLGKKFGCNALWNKVCALWKPSN